MIVLLEIKKDIEIMLQKVNLMIKCFIWKNISCFLYC